MLSTPKSLSRKQSPSYSWIRTCVWQRYGSWTSHSLPGLIKTLWCFISSTYRTVAELALFPVLYRINAMQLHPLLRKDQAWVVVFSLLFFFFFFDSTKAQSLTTLSPHRRKEPHTAPSSSRSLDTWNASTCLFIHIAAITLLPVNR